MEQSQTSVPKPFAYIQLADRVDQKYPAGHDRYDETLKTGRIEGIITALSPIHIGSGIIDFPEDVNATQDIDLNQNIEIAKTLVRSQGRAVIPGTSLKGTIRSVVEAISGSCVCKVSKDIREELPRDFVECQRRGRDRKKLCVACCMFGAMGFQGNIAIRDAQQTDGQIVTVFAPELHPPECYQFDTQDRLMRKFYMHGEVASGKTPVEVCEIGSKFRFDVQIDNLTPAEWGLFFTALGLHRDYPFKLKIGGMKPTCFGSIGFQIEKIRIQEQPHTRYLTWDTQQEVVKMDEKLKAWKRECITDASNSLIQQNLLIEIAKILQYPNTRDCPSGSY